MKNFHRVVAVFVAALLHTLRDGAYGLVPADAHPAGVFAFGVGAAHRVLHAVGVVKLLHGGAALYAQITAAGAGALVSRNAYHAAVLDSHPVRTLHFSAGTAEAANHLGFPFWRSARCRFPKRS